jgi:lipopolysaccharide biosynthesis glycosyltransferase
MGYCTIGLLSEGIHTIKFSHRYTKMPDRDRSILLQVFKTHYRDLSNVFIAYDTEIRNSHDYHPLPKTDLIVLFLIADDGKTWTTICRWIPQKEKCYRSITGQEVKIEIAK